MDIFRELGTKSSQTDYGNCLGAIFSFTVGRLSQGRAVIPEKSFSACPLLYFG